MGTVWQEWEHGIGGNLPAKLWKEQHTTGNSRYSRRKPIYLLLDRLINVKKKLPAEVFRVIVRNFPAKITTTKLVDEI